MLTKVLLLFYLVSLWFQIIKLDVFPKTLYCLNRPPFLLMVVDYSLVISRKCKITSKIRRKGRLVELVTRIAVIKFYGLNILRYDINKAVKKIARISNNCYNCARKYLST